MLPAPVLAPKPGLLGGGPAGVVERLPKRLGPPGVVEPAAEGACDFAGVPNVPNVGVELDALSVFCAFAPAPKPPKLGVEPVALSLF